MTSVSALEGDHSYVGTLVDLCVIAKRMIPGGVVIIDDIHNTDWPEVLQAWKAYVSDPKACDQFNQKGAAQLLEPVAAIGNKLYVTTLGVSPQAPDHWASMWAKAILDADQDVTARYKLAMRSGSLKLGVQSTDGPVSAMFTPNPAVGAGVKEYKLLSDELVLKGEEKTFGGDGGEPYPGSPGAPDDVLTRLHTGWLERSGNACP